MREKDPSGIPCPSCGATAAKVTNTVRHPRHVDRRRVCGCGHAFWTDERVRGDRVATSSILPLLPSREIWQSKPLSVFASPQAFAAWVELERSKGTNDARC